MCHKLFIKTIIHLYNVSPTWASSGTLVYLKWAKLVQLNNEFDGKLVTCVICPKMKHIQINLACGRISTVMDTGSSKWDACMQHVGVLRVCVFVHARMYVCVFVHAHVCVKVLTIPHRGLNQKE